MKTLAIASADWHLRLNKPKARLDKDWPSTLWYKVEQVLELCYEEDCPLLIAGDLGEEYTWPEKLQHDFISIINEYGVKIFTIPGQHDLPNHRINKWRSGGLGPLHEAGSIFNLAKDTYRTIQLYPNMFLYGCGWNEEIPEVKDKDPLNVLLIHKMIIKNKPEFPGQKAPKAKSFLNRYSDYDIIVSGDNHTPFKIEHDGRTLINCGNLYRKNADQIDYEPAVWLIKEDGSVKRHKLQIKPDMISRDHIIAKQEKDERVENYIKAMKKIGKVTTSFEDNVKKIIDANQPEIDIEYKIWEAIDGV
jgi:DNA repair exonuclease SbcCD nuclease subunit